MSEPLPIRRLLLDLLSTSRPVPPARLEAVDARAWTDAIALAEEHRIAPLLHMRCRDAGLTEALPVDVAKRLAAAHRTAALAALRHRAALVRLADLLDDIAFLALKGMWLAWHAYPDVALRPVRDIDLLVERDRAMPVYARLLDSGFERVPFATVDPHVALERHKHLPGLFSRELGVQVEIHTRVLPRKPWAAHASDWGTAGHFFGGQFEDDVAGRRIAYPAPTATLLHLIVHAVHDHRFDNGPLTIDDIAWTVRTRRIDWPRFWDMARHARWNRAASLMLDLAEREHGALPIDWRGHVRGATPAKRLEQAASLMFQSSGKGWVLANMDHVLGPTPFRQRVAGITGKLNPEPESIRAVLGIEHEAQRRWWHYFAWLRTRLQQSASGLQGTARADARNSAALGDWLNPERSKTPR